jgi:hypothetical protein
MHNNLWHFDHTFTMEPGRALPLKLTAPAPFATVLDDSERNQVQRARNDLGSSKERPLPMAAHAVHHSRSGRFVKAYLLTWGILATGALTYLGSLAWQPELLATPPPRTQVAEPEPDPALRTANKALAEVGTVQRSVGEIRRDVRQLKETVEQHEAQGKVIQSRLSALEDRATAPDVPMAAAIPPAATPSSKAAEKARKAEATAKAHVRTPAEPITTTRVVTTIEGPTKPAAEAAPAQIETGSIAQLPITFGDAVVTTTTNNAVVATATPPVAPAAPSTYAVQLGAGPSLDALRLSWSMLVERHGAALASLQPRFVAPRNAGGPYRLVAGPLPSKAEAEKVCAEMGVGRNGCFSTQLAGEPL